MSRGLSYFVVSVWLFAVCCGNVSTDATGASGDCIGPTCQAGTQNKTSYTMTGWDTAGAGGRAATGLAGAGADAIPALPKLCSVQSPTCDPDDVTACNSPRARGGGGDSGTETGGAAAVQGVIPAGAAGVEAAGRASSLACRVGRYDAQPVTRCEPAGNGALGAPCVSDQNCAAGFSCVEESGTAQCRPYCCRGDDSCPTGTYCDVRPVKELEELIDRIWVSVCMPGASCRFDEPYSCPADRKCSCPAGKTCGAVRGDGTTACVTPGDGLEGEPCPCAANHVCADSLGSCLKVCDLTSREVSCGEQGICQNSTNLPYPWGICVSSSAFL